MAGRGLAASVPPNYTSGMWKLSRERAELHDLVYIPDPRDGYKYVLLKCTFSCSSGSDVRVWDNSAVKSTPAVKALVVLTAWMVSMKPFCPCLHVVWRGGGPELHVLQHRLSDGRTSRRVLSSGYPECVGEALATVKADLESSYGVDPYLDT